MIKAQLKLRQIQYINHWIKETQDISVVVIQNKLNAKIGIKEAKNDQWEWVLKQLKMSVDDDISKTDAMKIYKFVCNIAKDYLYCQ